MITFEVDNDSLIHLLGVKSQSLLLFNLETRSTIAILTALTYTSVVTCN